MVAVQPEGCDPVAQAWRAGRSVQALDDCTSAVSGIILTSPPDGELVLDALRESAGWAVSVADETTYQAQAEMAAGEGIFAEPAAAVPWAAVKADKRTGRLTGEEKVVLYRDRYRLQRQRGPAANDRSHSLAHDRSG